MKNILPGVLLLATSGLVQASTIQSIRFDLSQLHAGSTLSGTFTLSDTPAIGDTAIALLTFSDPGDYTFTAPLSTTITIGQAITNDTIRFSTISFGNPGGNNFTKNNNLSVNHAAQCVSFPCSSSGSFDDNSPAAFTATYTIAPVATPEPNVAMMTPFVFAGMYLLRRRAAATR